MARHLALILFVLAGLLPMAKPSTLPAAILAPVALADGIAPPPLPRSCIGGGTPLDYAQPVCCVSGYVYLNGAPVAGASVTISAGGRTLTTQTQIYPGGPLPYFTVSLGADPLAVQPGDSVTISASAGGQSKSLSFTAQEGGQQVDVALPQIALNATWTPGERPGPSFRAAAMAYDAARARLLLFGGLGQPSETWAWDGRAWTRRVPLSAPPARSGHALAYDALRQRIVLFGGTDAGGGALSDTWEWDGASWENRTNGVAPAISGAPALVYDSVRARVLLVGAAADKLALWAWDGAVWAQLAPASAPLARAGFGLAYDARRGRVVIFGGLRAGVLQQDTWEYDGSAWARSYPLSPPSARSGHAMTYDPLRQRVLLVGGVGAAGKPLEDSWAWDGSAWATLNVDLPPRAGALLAYDSARQVPVLAGGYSDAAATTYPDETWELDDIDWSQRAPRVSPAARYDYQMAYQVNRKRVVLFSGVGLSRPVSNDTWEWDGLSWTRRTPPASPAYTYRGAMTYDEANQQVMLFGGMQSVIPGGAVVNTTWIWDGHTWAQRSPSASPSPRDSHLMVYDSIRKRSVLFGGRLPSTPNYANDTWEWDGTTWTDVTPTVSPEANFSYFPYAIMAYDPARERTVLLHSFSTAHTWEWDGRSWTPSASSAQAPDNNCLFKGPMAYDGTRQQVTFFGYATAPSCVGKVDVWDGANWSSRVVSPRPPQRIRFGLIPIPNQRLMLFGGADGGSYPAFDDTWLWDGLTWHEQPDDSYVPWPAQRGGDGLPAGRG